MFTDFSAWWHAMDMFQKVYWMIAIPFSVFFILQTLLSIFAGDVDHDASGHSDAGGTDDGIPFQFFTIKNMVAFFTILGWSGIACVNAGLSHWTTIVISVICGLLMMVFMASIFYFMSKLTESGNLNVKNAINKTGTVYIPVPASRKGEGKVQINVQSSLRELDAITDETETISTGTLIVVTDVLNNNILVVKRA
jgi:membrane protein implicated in regulation of membrane protease activity